jgi:hypothetical protein
MQAMRPSQINKRLDYLDKRSSRANDAMLKAGRGYEKYHDVLRAKDPLALHIRFLTKRQSELRDEIARRYGPGAPSRLPVAFRSTRRKL